MSFDDRLLNGVSALAAVVRSGGFAAAARSLNVSQPGSSSARGAGWNPTPGADDTLRLPHGRRQAVFPAVTNGSNKVLETEAGIPGPLSEIVT